MSWQDKQRFMSNEGLECYRVYPLAKVAPYLIDWSPKFYGKHELWLPTEMVVKEPQMAIPCSGRWWKTWLYLDEKDRFNQNEQVGCVEYYEEGGDDGHTEMDFRGLILFPHKDVERLLQMRFEWDPDRPLKLWEAIYEQKEIHERLALAYNREEQE